MKNPYEVLEIREGASKDEIKKAYKEMVKKYHPDQYGNNPLRDLAESKLKDLNEAYDYLMKQPDNSNPYRNNYSDNNYQGSSSYNEIRMALQNGNLNHAEDLLNRITIHDGEWNFLMGTLYMKKGWYDNAYNYLNMAVNSNPNNREYREALNRLNIRNNNYTNAYRTRGGRNDDMCDCCVKLWCADCCCECMGGDLISCC